MPEPEQFLYETLNAVSSMGFLKKEIPDSVAQNLNPQYELRGYQVEAFARFFYCYKNDFPGKTSAPPLSIQHGNGEWQDAHHGGADPVSL